MFDILAQHGIEISLGTGTAGVIVGAIGKHLLARKSKPTNPLFQTKEICELIHGQTKEALIEIKEIVKQIRDK